jgi:hypothetical protein
MGRAQRSFGDGLIADEVSGFREDWMTYADEVLADEEIVAIVHEVLAKRHRKAGAAAGAACRPTWRGAAIVDSQACPQLEL